MEENKNDVSIKEMELLVKEIGSGIIALRADRTGLKQELDKYNGRIYEEESNEIKSLKADLEQVEQEIVLKESEIERIQDVAVAKNDIDKKLDEINVSQETILGNYESTKKLLLVQRQERMASLISETEDSLTRLYKTMEQLNNELEKYKAKNFEQGIEELNGDLEKIKPEIEFTQQRLSDLKSETFFLDGVDNKLSQLENDYRNSLKDNNEMKQRLLKEKQAQNDIAEELMDKYNIRERYKNDLSKEEDNSIDNSNMPDWMKELEKDDLEGGKTNNSTKSIETNTVQTNEETVESGVAENGSLTKGTIIVPESRKQEPVQQNDLEAIEPETEMVEEQVNNEVPENMRNRLNSVRLTFESGYPEYEVSYNDKNGVLQFAIISDIEPRYMTMKEKQVYKKSIDPNHRRDLLGVDVGIIGALNEIDKQNGGTSWLGYQYINYLKDLIRNDKEKDENDIDIIYDLSNIKDSELSLRDRLTIGRIAAKSQRLGTAEYIPAPNKIRDFFRGFKQKELPEGNFEKVGNYAIDDLGDEKEFDMDIFLKQQEQAKGVALTKEEKENFMARYNANKEKIWKEELKVDTEILPKQEQIQNGEQKEREEETR